MFSFCSRTKYATCPVNWKTDELFSVNLYNMKKSKISALLQGVNWKFYICMNMQPLTGSFQMEIYVRAVAWVRIQWKYYWLVGLRSRVAWRNCLDIVLQYQQLIGNIEGILLLWFYWTSLSVKVGVFSISTGISMSVYFKFDLFLFSFWCIFVLHTCNWLIRPFATQSWVFTTWERIHQKTWWGKRG